MRISFHLGLRVSRGLLQQRMDILQVDLQQIRDFVPTDEYDLDSLLTDRNFEYQKQIANEMTHESNEILSLITSALDSYQIDVTLDSTVLIRTMTQLLASLGNALQSHTNFSFGL
ncbi:unnamed protein product [Adineta ricciae]|uniref:Uncharacterized protein n=1 Tax=Adineta ricciae TaxID=249248 RepID=A0A815BLB5_ADIRI|nr:unnamed protein product [Adineta ricciae]CAF1335370.1 unnamed protein product [Adineta ricciae]